MKSERERKKSGNTVQKKSGNPALFLVHLKKVNHFAMQIF